MAKTPPVEKCRKVMMCLAMAAGLLALYCFYLWTCLFGNYKPRCDLDRLDIPSNSSAATFRLTLSNSRNERSGVLYDPVNLTFSDKYNHSYNATVPRFYQGVGRMAKKRGTFNANGTNSAFRVDMKTQIRYRSGIWVSKRHRLELGALVSLDSNGSLVLKKSHFGIKVGVTLTSGAGPLDGPGVLFRALLLTAAVSFLYMTV